MSPRWRLRVVGTRIEELRLVTVGSRGGVQLNPSARGLSKHSGLLRRVFEAVASFATGYRRDRRHANVPQRDGTTNVLMVQMVQLDVNVLSAGRYR